MSHMGKPVLTRHASDRCNQRGIKARHLQCVLQNADLERQVGDGCFMLSISTHRLRALVSQGTLRAQTAERCARLTLIVSEDDSVITAYRCNHVR